MDEAQGWAEEGLGRGPGGRKQWGPERHWLLFSGGPLGCGRTCPGALATDATLTLPAALPQKPPPTSPLPAPAEGLAPRGQPRAGLEGVGGRAGCTAGGFTNVPQQCGAEGARGGGAAGAPRGPGGKWGEQRFHRAAPHTDGPLHMIREHRTHCAVDLKVLTKRNYGKYKSEKLDQDAQPPEPGIHGASFPEPPLRGGAAGRWGEQGARPTAKTEPRERLHTRAPRHARSAPPNPHRTLDCARWA